MEQKISGKVMFFKLVVKMYDFYLLLFFSPYYILFPHCAVFMPIIFLVQNYFAGTWQQGIIRLRTVCSMTCIHSHVWHTEARHTRGRTWLLSISHPWVQFTSDSSRNTVYPTLLQKLVKI